MKFLISMIGLSVVLSSGLCAPRETIVGAPASVNVDSQDVKEAAQFAVSSISDGYEGTNQLGLVRVAKASRQVVAGALYTLQLAVGSTDCAKASPKPVCSLADGADGSDHPDYQECTVKLVSGPAMDFLQVLSQVSHVVIGLVSSVTGWRSKSHFTGKPHFLSKDY